MIEKPDLRDIFIRKGEWDGSHYIIYLNGYIGVINWGSCSDIIAAYYNKESDRMELRIASIDDGRQSWISPEELDEDLLALIYKDIQEL